MGFSAIYLFNSHQFVKILNFGHALIVIVLMVGPYDYGSTALPPISILINAITSTNYLLNVILLPVIRYPAANHCTRQRRCSHSRCASSGDRTVSLRQIVYFLISSLAGVSLSLDDGSTNLSASEMSSTDIDFYIGRHNHA